MADSIEGIVPLPDMTEEQYRAATLPGKMLRPVDLATGVPDSPFQRWITVKSPLTGLGFQVKGVWQAQPKAQSVDSDLAQRLIGYRVAINVPSATIGNNCLLRNGVPKACELAVLMLKLWLLDGDAPPWVVQAIDVERMRLTMVTPTFLHRFPLNRTAKAALMALRVVTEIRNKPRIKGDKRVKARRPAFGVGTLAEGTAYLKERSFAFAAYLKSRYEASAAVFANQADEDAVYDEAELYVRAETELHESWLKENQLDRPEDWRLYGQDTAYRKAYALIRRSLRLDEGLRGDDPTEEDLQKARLVADDLTILQCHLDGGNAQLHPLVLAKKTLKAQQQYFSEVKLRILTRLRIDMTVEWAVQKAAMSAGVGAWLNYPGMYVPPPDLQHLVFSEASAALALRKLRTMLAERLPRTLSNIVVADEAEPLVELGQLEVSEKARRTLNKFRMPLHRLLECHALGCFGDVSPEEASRLADAARNGEPVTSRYVVGDRTILVTTEPATENSEAGTKVTRLDERQ